MKPEYLTGDRSTCGDSIEPHLCAQIREGSTVVAACSVVDIVRADDVSAEHAGLKGEEAWNGSGIRRSVSCAK